MKKAIALISGGLDSILAARLIKEQGIEAIGLKFKIPFSFRQEKYLPDLRIELKEIDIGEEFLKRVQSPQYGYGKNLNPCIDCKILMFRRAKEFMEQSGAKFIVTGEVLGQRPMSQNKQALKLIEKEAGLEDLIVRPLSAKLLLETLPEREGWISRDKLLDFNGRSRKPQIVLAKKFHIQDYAQPAGGCLLTDPEFSKRLKDLIAYGGLTIENIELLKIGRHFRISPDTKLIVGRDEKENARLFDSAKEGDYIFRPADIKGPVALGRGIFNQDLIGLSCNITCRYCDLDGKINADIVCKRLSEKENKVLKVAPIEEDKLKSLRI